MIEITEEKIDENTVRTTKKDWAYFKKDKLLEMKIRMENELGKVIQLLENFK